MRLEAELVAGQNIQRTMLVVQMLEYLHGNPDVADSLEGMVQWRLSQEQIRRTVHEIQQALEWLVEKEFVSKETNLASGALYHVNVKKKKEIERFLKDAKTERPTG